MLLKPFHWIVKNIRTLLLSFLLALVVWVSAVTAADPNEERTFSGVSLEVVGKAQDILVTSNNIPTQVSVTLYAPRSLLERYQTNQDSLLRAWIDLTGKEKGGHQVEVQVAYQLEPTILVRKNPEVLNITLDRLVSQSKPVRLVITGRVARGYQAETPSMDVNSVTVTGSDTLVAQVSEVRAALDIDAADEIIETSVRLEPLDANGDPISGLKLSPESVEVKQPITLLGGYRNVVVRVITAGQVANGYRLTNISVSPLGVTVFSANPQLVDDLPGYVETQPLDLTGVTDDLDVRMALDLPDGIAVVGDQSVLVQVSIAAIESSLTMSVPVETIGLSTGLSAQVAPDVVDVILSGPVLVLDSLSPSDVRVFVDLSDLEIGVYQLEPTVDILSERVTLQSLLPETLEVNVTIASTPTPTLTNSNIMTPTPTTTPQP